MLKGCLGTKLNAEVRVLRMIKRDGCKLNIIHGEAWLTQSAWKIMIDAKALPIAAVRQNLLPREFDEIGK